MHGKYSANVVGAHQATVDDRLRSRERAKVLFTYWGRRGPLTRFALEIGRAIRADPEVAAAISVSRQNQHFASFAELGIELFPIDTFSSNAGALLRAWSIVPLRTALARRIADDRITAVIELMPHVWSPLVMSAVQQAGARYCTIVHDADPHVGDPTSIVNRLLDQTLSISDLVLTLSSAVAGRLTATGRVPQHKVYTLFHPDLVYGPPSPPRELRPGAPVRLLFLGRILPYKGLPMFLDVVEQLWERGVPVEFGIFGEGELGASRDRIVRMRGEVVNRWLADEEIAAILARFDVVVLSHLSASQSGVVAAAHGAGMPVVATPVGGLVEQIDHVTNGMLARGADAPSLVDAIDRLVTEAGLYAAIAKRIRAVSEERSMARFAKDCIAHALYAGRVSH